MESLGLSGLNPATVEIRNVQGFDLDSILVVAGVRILQFRADTRVPQILKLPNAEFLTAKNTSYSGPQTQTPNLEPLNPKPQSPKSLNPDGLASKALRKQEDDSAPSRLECCCFIPLCKPILQVEAYIYLPS